MAAKVHRRLRQIDPRVAGHLFLHIDADRLQFTQRCTQIGFGLKIVGGPHLFGAADCVDQPETGLLDYLLESAAQKTLHVIGEIQSDLGELCARLSNTFHISGHVLQLRALGEIVFGQLRSEILQFGVAPNDQSCKQKRRTGFVATNVINGMLNSLLMQAPWELNAFRNSLATCVKSQKNNCDISKLLLRACLCDVRMADVQTLNRVPHASRALPISANNFNGRRDDISAACKLRLWQLDSSNNNTFDRLFFNCLIWKV